MVEPTTGFEPIPPSYEDGALPITLKPAFIAENDSFKVKLNNHMKLSAWIDSLSEFVINIVQSWFAVAVQTVIFLVWVTINLAFICQIVYFDLTVFVIFILFNCAVMAESVFYSLMIMTASTRRAIETLKADHDMIASLKAEIENLKRNQK